MTLASTAKPSPLTRPAFMHARTTASNTWRKILLSRNRPWRLTGNLVIEIEPAEPPISQVQLNLLAQPQLEADAVAVAHDQHSDHELRVDRRSTDVAIERCQLLAQVSQHLHYNRIDPAQEMARWNAPFEVE